MRDCAIILIKNMAHCTHALAGGFSAAECVFFVSVVQGTELYTEWGSGSSTLLAAAYAKNVISIEGSLAWTQKMQNETSLLKNVDLRYVSIGDTGAFSWPKNASLGYNYIHAMDHLPLQNVVLVDGRYRVACALRARQTLAPNGVVLVHDFMRKKYHVLLTNKAFKIVLLHLIEISSNLIICISKLINRLQY